MLRRKVRMKVSFNVFKTITLKKIGKIPEQKCCAIVVLRAEEQPAE